MNITAETSGLKLILGYLYREEIHLLGTTVNRYAVLCNNGCQPCQSAIAAATHALRRWREKLLAQYIASANRSVDLLMHLAEMEMQTLTILHKTFKEWHDAVPS